MKKVSSNQLTEFVAIQPPLKVTRPDDGVTTFVNERGELVAIKIGLHDWIEQPSSVNQTDSQ